MVFGTSLSDPGNLFALVGEENTPPYNTLDILLIPGAPYAVGGHHFSNGATWVEQLARPMGLAGNTRPAFGGSDTEATNYAVGGARAREDGLNVNLATQVNAFLTAFQGKAPSDALYVIEMGANDVRDALAVSASGGDGGAVIQAALQAIGTNIVTLYYAGARKFLVWNVPDIGWTPALRMLAQMNQGADLWASFIATSFNSNLDGVLATLAQFPGIEIAKLDVFQALHEIAASPEAFGLAVADRACVMPNTPPYACREADDYLFWDGIHPTRAVHSIVAQKAAAKLALE